MYTHFFDDFCVLKTKKIIYLYIKKTKSINELLQVLAAIANQCEIWIPYFGRNSGRLFALSFFNQGFSRLLFDSLDCPYLLLKMTCSQKDCRGCQQIFLWQCIWNHISWFLKAFYLLRELRAKMQFKKESLTHELKIQDRYQINI